MYNIDSQAKFRPEPDHTVKAEKPSTVNIVDTVKGRFVLGNDIWYVAETNLGKLYTHSSNVVVQQAIIAEEPALEEVEQSEQPEPIYKHYNNKRNK